MPNQDQLNLQDLRRNYETNALDEHDVPAEPIALLKQWLKEAKEASILEPNAMVLATVGMNGRPSARVVLLKELEQNGLVFYTNYNSRKGKELASTGYAAANFFWDKLERQVRIEGKVEKEDREQSEAYFNSRPKASQIGAIISPQSQEIDGRYILEKAKAELEQSDLPLNCPAHWGGYRIIPETIEFWQGRPSRLHDRLVFEKEEQADGHYFWKLARLAP